MHSDMFSYCNNLFCLKVYFFKDYLVYSGKTCIFKINLIPLPEKAGHRKYYQLGKKLSEIILRNLTRIYVSNLLKVARYIQSIIIGLHRFLNKKF